MTSTVGIAWLVATCVTGATSLAAQQADSVRRDSVRDCVRRCAGGETMPVLISFPHIDASEAPESKPQSSSYPQGAGGLGQVGIHGTVVFTLVVMPNGEMDRRTVHVFSSTARNWEPVVRRALEEARFRPATDSGRPVPAWVQFGLDIRAEGLASMCTSAAVLSNATPQKPLQYCYTVKDGG